MESTNAYDIVGIAWVAEYLGVSATSLRAWHRAGILSPTYLTPGGHRRYTSRDIEAFKRTMTDPKEYNSRSKMINANEWTDSQGATGTFHILNVDDLETSFKIWGYGDGCAEIEVDEVAIFRQSNNGFWMPSVKAAKEWVAGYINYLRENEKADQ